MPLVNAYDAKQTSAGITLLDLVGANNGTLRGNNPTNTGYDSITNPPILNLNGYVTFDGNHANIQGYRQHIFFSFAKPLRKPQDVFSYICIIKQGTISAIQHLFEHYMIGALGMHRLVKQSTNLGLTAQAQGSTSGIQSVAATITSAKTKYELCGLIHDGLNGTYGVWDTKLTTIDSSELVGNLYSNNSSTMFGAAQDASGRCQYDFKGNLLQLMYFNHKLTNAEISNYNSKLKGILI